MYPNRDLFQADVLILAVKPQVILEGLAVLTDRIPQEQLVVSIAAGVRLSQLEDRLHSGTRVIRVMPNTPCLVGAGASGMSSGTHATAADMKLACALLESVGIVETIPEKLMDALTGLSGSGPAYFFYLMESMIRAGKNMGLDEKVATWF